MKKALRAATLFMLAAVLLFSLISCKNSDPAKNDEPIVFALSGNITVNPSSARTGAELTATYTGHETVTFQWQLDGEDVGTNSNKLVAAVPGDYNVTVSREGYRSKTSNNVFVFNWNSAKPIITSIFTADPSAHVWHDWNNKPENSGFPPRLFLYPSQDVFPAQGCNLMDRYHVFSTNNMVDWIDHGEILRRDDLDENIWGPKWPDAMFMWAPDAAYNPNAKDKDGNPIGPYFYYFPHTTGGDRAICWECRLEMPECALPANCGPGNYDSANWGDNWYLGVTWSEHPHQGFDGSKAVKMKYPNGVDIRYAMTGTSPRLLGGLLIDPCIFHDKDDGTPNGTYYLVTGGSQEFRIAKLRDDMITLDEDFHVYSQQQLPYYHEGPWMFTRRNNAGTKIYYLMYPGKPGNAEGDDMLYAISDSPYGPWNYKGSILDPVGTGDTSHGSIAEFNGKWYLFYHNAALSKGAGTLRSVCVDELFFEPDGSIRKVNQTTTSVTRNGPEFDKAALDAQFGVGTWTLEIKYDEMESGDFEGFVFDKKYNFVTGGSLSPNVTIANGARVEGNHVGHLHEPGSYVEISLIDGGTGGRALLQLEYALANDGAALRVNINGVNGNLPFHLPRTGGWSQFADSGYYIVNLVSGANNTIKLDGAGVNIRSLSISLEE